MAKINHIIGSLLEPVTQLNKILIVHCVNNEYKFGSGIAGAILKKWPIVKEKYLDKAEWSLGDIQYVKVTDKINVVNLCGQRGVGNYYETAPIRYESIQDGFIQIREDLRVKNILKEVSINLGRLGCTRAKGDWSKVDQIIRQVFKDVDIEINVYTLENEMDQFCWPMYWNRYGDDKKCVCGHSYYRHFDTYEQMYPIGCKYCECYKFQRAT